jgi:hypothetical protein
MQSFTARIIIPAKTRSNNFSIQLPGLFRKLVIEVKVKVTHPRYRPKQAQRVDRGIAVSFPTSGVWSASRPGRFTPMEDPAPILQEAGWASGTVWTYAKNLAPTGN